VGAGSCRRAYGHLFWEANVDAATAWGRWGESLRRGEGSVVWRRDEAAELLSASLADEVGMPERMAQETVEYWQPRLEGQSSGGSGGGTGLVRAALLSQEAEWSLARLEVTRSEGNKADATAPGVGVVPGVAAAGGPASVVVGASSCQRVYVVLASEEAV